MFDDGVIAIVPIDDDDDVAEVDKGTDDNDDSGPRADVFRFFEEVVEEEGYCPDEKETLTSLFPLSTVPIFSTTLLDGGGGGGSGGNDDIL